MPQTTAINPAPTTRLVDVATAKPEASKAGTPKKKSAFTEGLIFRSRWVGLLLTFAGVATMALPAVATRTSSVTFAVILILVGLVVGGAAWLLRDRGSLVTTQTFGVAAIATGIAGLVNPDNFINILSLAIILSFIGDGLLRVVDSIRWYRHRGSGWLMATGLIGLATATFLISHYPATAPMYFGVVTGAILMISGLNSLAVSELFQERSEKK